jgi:hypothetical protein
MRSRDAGSPASACLWEDQGPPGRSQEGVHDLFAHSTRVRIRRVDRRHRGVALDDRDPHVCRQPESRCLSRDQQRDEPRRLHPGLTPRSRRTSAARRHHRRDLCSGVHGNTDPDADPKPKPNSNADANTDPNTNTNADADADADANPDADSNADADANTDADAYADPNPDRGHDLIGRRDRTGHG